MSENYVSPYEKKMRERLDACSETELMKKLIMFLLKEEESDSGRVFHPNKIDSVRCLDGLEMNDILSRLDKLWKQNDK